MTHEERLQNLKEKSEDDFEKNITFISSGALALSITFISDIVDIADSKCLGVLIASWGMFIATLISNLLSHLYSSHIMDLCQDDRDSPEEEANWRRRSRKITVWNILNVGGLMLGILLFVIFVSVNVHRMANEKKHEQVTRPNRGGLETHGRTPPKRDTVVVQPAKPKENPKPKE